MLYKVTLISKAGNTKEYSNVGSKWIAENMISWLELYKSVSIDEQQE